MDPFQDSDWDLEYFTRILDDISTDAYLNVSPSAGVEVDGSFADVVQHETGVRKRERNESSVGLGSKAFREKLRRVRMNERQKAT